MRNVRGVLFLDYVRMLKAQKGVDWAAHLAPEDLPYLQQTIESAAWYPMASFERMGNGILDEIAAGDVEAARMWGRISVDQLRAKNPMLVADGDPLETLMRFRVLRSTFFDFDALDVRSVSSSHATILVHYYMGAKAEEAASFQTMGFFERLLDVAGASAVSARFTKRSWAGDDETVLELEWERP